MKALKKGAWLKLSFLPSSGKNFLLLHVNRKREKKFRLKWRRALYGIDSARCLCSTLMW